MLGSTRVLASGRSRQNPISNTHLDESLSILRFHVELYIWSPKVEKPRILRACAWRARSESTPRSRHGELSITSAPVFVAWYRKVETVLQDSLTNAIQIWVCRSFLEEMLSDRARARIEAR